MTYVCLKRLSSLSFQFAVWYVPSDYIQINKFYHFRPFFVLICSTISSVTSLMNNRKKFSVLHICKWQRRMVDMNEIWGEWQFCNLIPNMPPSATRPPPPKGFEHQTRTGSWIKVGMFCFTTETGEVEEEPVTFRRNSYGRIPSGMEEFFDKPIIWRKKPFFWCGKVCQSFTKSRTWIFL